jgi:hypothetical protein
MMRLPNNNNQAARDALAHRPRTAGETPAGLPPYPREWAGRVAVGEGPQPGLSGGANLGWSYQPRFRQPAKEQSRCAAWPLIRQVGNLSPEPDSGGGASDVGKASAGVAGDSHTMPSAAAGIDYSRVEGRPGALRTTVTQNLICGPYFLSQLWSLMICSSWAFGSKSAGMISNLTKYLQTSRICFTSSFFAASLSAGSCWRSDRY